MGAALPVAKQAGLILRLTIMGQYPLLPQFFGIGGNIERKVSQQGHMFLPGTGFGQQHRQNLLPIQAFARCDITGWGVRWQSSLKLFKINKVLISPHN
jgi:hypothetical protein